MWIGIGRLIKCKSCTRWYSREEMYVDYLVDYRIPTCIDVWCRECTIRIGTMSTLEYDDDHTRHTIAYNDILWSTDIIRMAVRRHI